jgi:phosphatidylinositol glycan class B
LTLACSTYIDYRITGRLVLPILAFTHYNLLNPIAAFYGATDVTYHLVQTIPILTFPFILPFTRGMLANLLPSRLHFLSLDKYDRPAGLRIVTRAMAFAITVLSLSTHSEWRFLHPFLPIFIALTISPLSVAYTPTILGSYRLMYAIRGYLRMSKWHFYAALLAMVPYLYLAVHGRAQVQVMDVLRRGELGEVTGLVALMPCHSTPWYSHLHRDVPGWFLTCEPPIGYVATSTSPLRISCISS